MSCDEAAAVQWQEDMPPEPSLTGRLSVLLTLSTHFLYPLASISVPLLSTHRETH